VTRGAGAVLAAIALALAGCGGGDEDPPAAPAQAPARTATPQSGKELFASLGCSGCHAIGTRRVTTGPAMRGLAGSRVPLADGRRVRATRAYLRRSILQPDAQVVKGYRSGLMSSAIESFDLTDRPRDVAALIRYIESLR
jgi:cytochrome c oxidase subunit 2